ncbi:MAG: hypothetical protein QXK96_06790 [Candidatus Bathyarchaeia archaeon]
MWDSDVGAPYSPKARSVITLEVSEQSVKLGSGVKVSGSIWPVHLALVFLQVSKDEGETWSNLAMAASVNGTYSYEWRPESAGTYLLRAFWAGDMDHKKMTSPSVRVEVT